MAERLQKLIAAAGLASRREAEEWILRGRVQVNGKTVTALGTKADPGLDRITVDGRPLRLRERPRYFVLYKPRGVLSARRDAQGRPVVTDLLRRVPERLFPVGRLDFNSEGLLLLTNDGSFALRVSHPRYGVRKTYRVKVRGVLSEKEQQRILRGIRVEGRPVAPLDFRRAGGKKNPWYLVTLVEGKNREVRRIFDAVGHPVVRLIRVQIGSLKIGKMRPGQARELLPEELRTLTPPGPARGRDRRSSGSGPEPRARFEPDESEE